MSVQSLSSDSGTLTTFAPGALDPTFGTGGQVTTDFDNRRDFGAIIATDAAGNILLGGTTYSGSFYTGDLSIDFVLVRYTKDGQIDRTFGNGGKVSTSFGSLLGRPGALSFLSGGRITVDAVGNILLSGSSYKAHSILVRFTHNGQLDTTFGHYGKAATRSHNASSMYIDAAGNILSAGTSDRDFALTRYTPSGEIDTTFGYGGQVTTDFNGSVSRVHYFRVEPASSLSLATYLDPAGHVIFGPPFAGGSSSIRSVPDSYLRGGATANAITTDATGNILVAGFSSSESDSAVNHFALARYTDNGQLDATLGNGGKVLTGFDGGSAAVSSITVDVAGNILVAGNANGDFALARYNRNGQLDTSFGNGGKVITDFNGRRDYGREITTDAVGNILVIGLSWSGAERGYAAARYTRNGQLDPSFGNGGKLILDLDSSDDSYRSFTTDASGGILLGGFTANNSDSRYDFTVARFEANTITPPSPSKLLWRNQTDGSIVMWSMQDNAVSGSSTLAAAIPDGPWEIAGAADFDGDNQLDLIGRNSETNAIKIWLLDANQQFKGEVDVAPNPQPGQEWQIVGIDDFNGDLQGDILWRHQSTGQLVHWYLGGAQGGALKGARSLGAFPDLGWKVEATGDFNNDQATDIVWRHQESGQLSIWYMNDQGILLGGDVLEGPDANWEILGSGDYNGDGKTDLSWRHKVAGTIVTWSLDQGNIIGGSVLEDVDPNLWTSLA